jgi:putative membrane protein
MQTHDTHFRLSAVLLTMVLTIGLSACTAPSAPVTKAAAAMSKPFSSGEILQVMQTINNGELKQAELVFQQPTPAEVQKMATLVIKDHTASNQRIAAMVKASGIKLEESPLSRGLQMQMNKTTEALAKLKDTAFDCAYLQKQIEQHALALDTVQKQLLPGAENPQIKEFLATAATSLASHHQAAQKSRASMAECSRA